MPRPHRLRRVAQKPAIRRFKPAGVRLQEMQTLNLGEDELEALRLADLEGLYQEEAARQMGISRATFARLIARGRATVADALVNGKGLLIGEGPVAPPGEAADPGRCPVHGGRRRRGRRCHCHDERRGHGAPSAYDEEESLQERRKTCRIETEQDPVDRVHEQAEVEAAAEFSRTKMSTAEEPEQGADKAAVKKVKDAKDVKEEAGDAEDPCQKSRAQIPNPPIPSQSLDGEKTVKIAISSQGPELSSPMDPRFGRAPYLLILEKPSGQLQVVDNSGNASAPQGAGIGAVASLKQYDVDVLVTGHVGPKAEKALRAAGIRVQLASGTNCEEALRSLNG